MAERIGVAAEVAREADRLAIKEIRELSHQTMATMSRATGTIRANEEQRRHMLYAIGGAFLAISLLWLIYPGWAASIGPQGWQWPERVARRRLGEPTLWDADIRLMRAGNPEGWQAIVDAADMARSHRDTRLVRTGSCQSQGARAMRCQDKEAIIMTLSCGAMPRTWLAATALLGERAASRVRSVKNSACLRQKMSGFVIIDYIIVL